ncbi:MAG: hypothetical protein M9887_02100 [Chitinophagales bacterium]|nr:hypothetical protein [Chitinophagales bacterium]
MDSFFNNANILVSPLDWGLGHATRSTPIIQRLLDKGAHVFLAGDGASLQFLQEYFPQLETIELPSYHIEYPTGMGGAWKTVFKAPKIIETIKNEQKFVEDLVKKLHLQAIISDNRYGVYSAKIPSIFMGHQLKVLPPKGLRWGAGAILRWHKTYLKHFTEVWIPDFPDGENLSGELSHRVDVGIPVKFIGPQSRFSLYEKNNNTIDAKKIVVVLSGPEPQRTLLEDKLKAQLKELKLNCTLVRGVICKDDDYTDENISVIHYLHGRDLFHLLNEAAVVISRPGYSTLMDLSQLNKKVILIPTPGQTEQQYLAENLALKNLAVVQKQSQLNLQSAFRQIEQIQALPKIHLTTQLLDEQLDSLGKRL